MVFINDEIGIELISDDLTELIAELISIKKQIDEL